MQQSDGPDRERRSDPGSAAEAGEVVQAVQGVSTVHQPGRQQQHGHGLQTGRESHSGGVPQGTRTRKECNEAGSKPKPGQNNGAAPQREGNHQTGGEPDACDQGITLRQMEREGGEHSIAQYSSQVERENALGRVQRPGAAIEQNNGNGEVCPLRKEPKENPES